MRKGRRCRVARDARCVVCPDGRRCRVARFLPAKAGRRRRAASAPLRRAQPLAARDVLETQSVSSGWAQTAVQNPREKFQFAIS
ncbi:MAG: hypothetical protein GY820_36705, partial [Gammaproteobacteria bacterium]|nr:hypothetical protein [Gammaproteobacteria bacterium]